MSMRKLLHGGQSSSHAHNGQDNSRPVQPLELAVVRVRCHFHAQ
jgi:hypothetical protein